MIQVFHYGDAAMFCVWALGVCHLIAVFGLVSVVCLLLSLGTGCWLQLYRVLVLGSCEPCSQPCLEIVGGKDEHLVPHLCSFRNNSMLHLGLFSSLQAEFLLSLPYTYVTTFLWQAG